MVRSGKEKEFALHYLTEDSFDYGFDLGTIAPKESVVIRYTIDANPVSFGKFQVGLLEK